MSASVREVLRQLADAASREQRGDLDGAARLCEAVLRVQPKNPVALNLLGVVAGRTHQPSRALVLFDKAIAAEPGFATAHRNRSLALHSLRRLPEAVASVRQALALQPGLAEAWLQLGNLQRELGLRTDAVASYDAAIFNRPGFAEAYGNRGVVLNDLHRLDEALASYDRALALQPDNVTAHCNRAYTLLLSGDLGAGLPAYESRWRLPPNRALQARRDLMGPPWRGGESLQGKTIWIYPEQGFGDTLQFCRYVPLLAQLGATVVLEVQAPLVGLLAALEGAARVTGPGAPPPHFDHHCPLLSLPLAFGTTLPTIPARASYLPVDAARLDAWRARLGARRAPRLGLVWSGSQTNANDAARSIALAQVAAFLPAGWEVFGLQKDVRSADRRTLRSLPQLVNLGPELQDFADTALACLCMDAVLTVDTSVAHLSAALGRDTRILLPCTPDWRWLLGRSDSPWYPTVRLYRQDQARDWNPVLAAVRDDLQREAPPR